VLVSSKIEGSELSVDLAINKSRTEPAISQLPERAKGDGR